jgi:hypothetical protein
VGCCWVIIQGRRKRQQRRLGKKRMMYNEPTLEKRYESGCDDFSLFKRGVGRSGNLSAQSFVQRTGRCWEQCLYWEVVVSSHPASPLHEQMFMDTNCVV